MALNIGGLLAGAGVVGQAMRKEEEAQRVARQNQLKIEEQNRLELLRQQQVKASAPEAVRMTDVFNIGQQRPMDVEQVPVTSTEPAVITPDQARAAAQERLKTTPQIQTVPGGAALPYGQMVPNSSADPLMLQRATEMAQLNKMKVDGITKALQRTDLPPNIRRNLEQQRDMYQQRLDANNQVITRNQPTIDYGREGRNYQIQQQQQTPGADATTAIRNVIGREGGMVNNPADRGGLTKYGISQAAYPKLDITGLTADQAAAIYKRDYWDAIKADELPPAIREMAFDAAVNQGVNWTKTALEQSKGDPAVFLQLREQRYRDIVAANPSQQQFLAGWLNRLAEFRQPGAATQVAAATQPVQLAQAPTGTVTDVTAGTTGPVTTPGVTQQDIQELASPNASVAMKAFLDKNYNEAYRQWRKTPDEAESKYGMGRLLYEGLGGDANKDKGLRLLTEAAQQGYAPATSFLNRIGSTQVAQTPTGPVVPGPIASAATPGVRQTQETKSPAAFYAANPQAITGDQQILNGQYQRVRAEAIRKFQMAQQAGMGTQAEAIRDQIVQLDEAYKSNSILLQGMNGLYQLEYGNDPRAVSAVMSYYVGQPVAFQPRSDGTFNMWVNGRKVSKPMTKDEVRVAAREMFDEKYRADKAAKESEFNTKRMNSAFEMMAKRDQINAEMIKDIMVQNSKGEWELRKELSKQGWDVKPDTGTGTIILTPPPWMQQQGVPPYIFNPRNKETVSPDGVPVPASSAVPILNIPSAVKIAGGR